MAGAGGGTTDGWSRRHGQQSDPRADGATAERLQRGRRRCHHVQLPDVPAAAVPPKVPRGEAAQPVRLGRRFLLPASAHQGPTSSTILIKIHRVKFYEKNSSMCWFRNKHAIPVPRLSNRKCNMYRKNALT